MAILLFTIRTIANYTVTLRCLEDRILAAAQLLWLRVAGLFGVAH